MYVSKIFCFCWKKIWNPIVFASYSSYSLHYEFQFSLKKHIHDFVLFYLWLVSFCIEIKNVLNPRQHVLFLVFIFPKDAIKLWNKMSKKTFEFEKKHWKSFKFIREKSKSFCFYAQNKALENNFSKLRERKFCFSIFS